MLVVALLRKWKALLVVASVVDLIGTRTVIGIIAKVNMAERVHYYLVVVFMSTILVGVGWVMFDTISLVLLTNLIDSVLTNATNPTI